MKNFLFKIWFEPIFFRFFGSLECSRRSRDFAPAPALAARSAARNSQRGGFAAFFNNFSFSLAAN
jgi:hypothetical protein